MESLIKRLICNGCQDVSKLIDLSYEDCVGEGAMELYPPTDDPPPYSLENPHLSNELALSIGTEDTPWTTQESSGHLLPTPLLSSLWLHFAPPYRTRSKMSVHSPVISVDA